MSLKQNKTGPLLALLAGISLILALAACGEDGSSGGGDGDTGGPGLDEDIEYPETGVTARFNLELARETEFFAFPWPSDLRLHPGGGLDLFSFPSGAGVGGLLEDFLEAAEERVDGFSNVSAVYFTFGETLDVASLPEDAAASVTSDASAYIIDIDPDSPWYGRRHPVDVIYRDEDGVYYSEHTLMLQPLYGFPLRSDTLYAGVVTTGVRDELGRPAIGPDAFRDLFEGDADPEIQDGYEPFLEAVEDLGIHPNTISSATVFTTSNPLQELVSLRQWIHDNLSTPTADGVFLASNGYQYDIYEGTYPFIEMQDGTPPFRRFGEGVLTIGPDGEPATQVAADLRFSLSIPPGDMPDDGWPVLLYLHGTGGDHLSFTRNATAREMARRGVAVIGVDQPLHGTRNPTEEDPLDLVISLSVGNLLGGAGMLEQGAADLYQVTRLLRDGITISASVSATGEAIRTDPNRIAFMGHSQGAQVGPLFLAVEPDVVAGVLSEGGGGAAITAILRKDNDIDIEQILSIALGIDNETEKLEVNHPVLSCIAQPLFDNVDPLSYARHIVLEPPHGVSHNFLMTIGFQDDATPPPGIEALASAAGLPIAEPVFREVEAMTLQGIPSVSLPVSNNMPGVDGQRPTGALIEFPGRDHFVVSRDVGAQYQVYEFISTALDGRATIFPAIDR